MCRKLLTCFLFGLASLVLLLAGDLNATSSAAFLTANEQSLLLRSAEMNDAQTATFHVEQAKQLLQKMDTTVPTPPIRTGGYRLIKPIVYHLEKARQAGISYNTAFSQIYDNAPIGKELIKLRKQSLANNMKSVTKLGSLTSENMLLLEQSRAPRVTKGNQKYIGDVLEVHHRALYHLSPKYENEVANLQLLPKSMHDEKWVHEVDISRSHEVQLDKAYKSARIQTAGKFLETGGKWLGRLGTVVSIGAEVYYIQGFARGKISDREFCTAQSTIIVGSGGAWVGIETGGAIGLILAGGPEDPLAAITVPIGAIIGGFAGGFGGASLGNMAASGFYGQLDDDQKQQVESFIYRHYGVAVSSY